MFVQPSGPFTNIFQAFRSHLPSFEMRPAEAGDTRCHESVHSMSKGDSSVRSEQQRRLQLNSDGVFYFYLNVNQDKTCTCTGERFLSKVL